MKIPVVYSDNSPGWVRPEELQQLIDEAAIVSFLRSDGEAVQVGVDPVRGVGGRIYMGPERRGKVGFC
ncbi:hypothetical protein L4X63_19550 [Geomonas sp. Red32]|uniref:GSU3473 family protein n=1 Tax=Geomonas sp. Red32 TaxID=2912856 RepID=UPI00202CD13B|nr:hypothetical protein [Geomonas sp. Red32]MCM0083787.1 hypothetical protein [Geomonas sp. Red32]